MLAKRIIPCLDVRDNRVVKGVRFQNLRDSGDPQQLAAAYEEQGADELVVLDVSATLDRRKTQRETVERVREVLSIPLTVGGGIRELADVARLLEAGADRVSVNTAAVEQPSIIADIANDFGVQCTVLALDATRTAPGQWQVVTHSGKNPTGRDALQWAEQAEQLGAGEILLTSFDQDGTGEGYDLDLLTAMTQRVRIPVIASGGAAWPHHLQEAFQAGASAVLAASIFHDGRYTVGQVKKYLLESGENVRPC